MVEELIKFTIFGVSLFLMFFLSKYLVESLTHFSKKLRVSDFMIGSIVLAVGTSLPEIIDSVVASTLNLGDLVMGILIGSNISNLLFILSMAVLIKSINNVEKSVIKESWVLLIVTVLFILACFDSSISRLEGLIMIASFAAYHWVLHREDAHAGGMVYVREIQADIVLTPIAIFTIILCGWLVINTGASIAIEMGISMSFFGLIIMALTTSLPELSSSLVSAKKGYSKLVLGNIFGSNATNLLLAAGLAAVIKPLFFTSEGILGFSALLLLLVSGAFTFWIQRTRRIGKKIGFTMIFVYILYLIVVSSIGGGS